MDNAKCKICRRSGVKLFLKGEKCLLPKCPMVKKSYPPGEKRKKRGGRRGAFSEYAKELREKQKLKNWYNLREKQFRKYVKESLSKRGQADAATLLVKTLESRLDNVIFRLGFATSREQAKQLISHNHFLINEKAVNIPSFLVQKGDKIKLKPTSSKKNIFQNLSTLLKKHQVPTWLELNIEKLEGKIVGQPTLEEVTPPVEISAIFEYYSR